MERIKTPTVGQLKKFFNENNIPDDAEIVMYNSMDEGDCFAGSATYFAPGGKSRVRLLPRRLRLRRHLRLRKSQRRRGDVRIKNFLYEASDGLIPSLR